MSAAFCIFGLSLIFQASRWGATPAYHVLLLIFRAQAWGIIFLLSGASMGAAAWQPRRRWLTVAALTLAFTLTTGWMLAFIVRYLTSPDTTPETWVSWAVFDYLLLVVAVSIDLPGRPARPDPVHAADFRQAVDDALTAAAETQRTRLLRTLEAAQEEAHDAIGAACFAYGQAVAPAIPAAQAAAPEELPGPALEAITGARRAMQLAEEAYALAVQHAQSGRDAS